MEYAIREPRLDYDFLLALLVNLAGYSVSSDITCSLLHVPGGSHTALHTRKLLPLNEQDITLLCTCIFITSLHIIFKGISVVTTH